MEQIQPLQIYIYFPSMRNREHEFGKSRQEKGKSMFNKEFDSLKFEFYQNISHFW